MRAVLIHKIVMILLLSTSISYAMDLIQMEHQWHSITIQQNNSEKEIHNLDLYKKETTPQYKLVLVRILNEGIPSYIHEEDFTLQHFEKTHFHKWVPVSL